MMNNEENYKKYKKHTCLLLDLDLNNTENVSYSRL